MLGLASYLLPNPTLTTSILNFKTKLQTVTNYYSFYQLPQYSTLTLLLTSKALSSYYVIQSKQTGWWQLPWT